jgi:hypothetical protein
VKAQEKGNLSKCDEEARPPICDDLEYGYNLPREEALAELATEIWIHGYSQTLERMLPKHPQQMKLFVWATEDVSFGVGAEWKERNGWKTKAASLGKHITGADAALFRISMVRTDLLSNLSRTYHKRAENVTDLRSALIELQSTSHWRCRSSQTSKEETIESKRKEVK